VALSGLITEAVVDRGQKCGFDEFSKLVSLYFIVEAPLTESKVREILLTRLQNKDLFLCRELSDEEEHLVEDSENMSRY
jgi:hypothetical protein